ncbi:uncharacterized protein LOC125069551 [Vanessa atalanta]|uniref:uncharacterized protein LOC125069551 n=1 Tax=Vanessa atalanta TaxID=42275 RepID=UPI001FCDDFC2|nr:uncharacterized protein LOC125069551 [Vanessa atalanta]
MEGGGCVGLPGALDAECAQKKHHSLLHPERKETVREESQEDHTNIVSHFTKQPGQILLATALVDVSSSNGNIGTYRALIDQGSQASFVSEDIVQTLRLKREKINGVVTGLSGGNQLSIKHMVEVNLRSKVQPTFTVHVKAYVLRNITNYLPTQQITMFNWPELDNKTLADPEFHIPNKIQLLLGAEVYSKIIDVGLLKSPSGSIVAQSTYLGWILSGDTNDTKPVKEKQTISLHISVSDNEQLKRFWEIENEVLTNERKMTKEEQMCEEIYKKTTVRVESGRYKVHIPFKENIEPVEKCGKTKEIATSRFLQLERKFKYNIKLKQEYCKVINEYLALGHMVKVNEENNNAIYLPHHAILRDDKDTTKLRVVFDASAKGSKGFSLNDTMLTGPVIQRDLRTLIMEWRTYKIALHQLRSWLFALFSKSLKMKSKDFLWLHQ